MSQSSKRTVCVLMASSRVGRAAIDSLLQASPEKSVHVRAVFRTPERAAASELPPSIVEMISGFDSSDSESLGRAFKGASSVLIVAPQAENRDNVVNSLMDGAKKFGVRHVVLIGGVFQEEEKFLFHKQWMSSRRHAESLGLAWTQLECSDFMENVYFNQESINNVASTFYTPSLEGCSSPVALSDVGRAAAAILSSEGDVHHNRPYRIVGGETMTATDLASVMSKVLGKCVECVEVGIESAKKAAVESGATPKWQAEGFYDWVGIYYVSGRLRNVESDLPKLGINPTSFEQWFRDRVSDFR